MDFDQNSANQLGSDGCLDFNHPANAGLPDIWCEGCALTELYNRSFSSMSRADFWVAAANAVIRHTSIRSALELPFRWGRVDSDNCPQSSERLPEPTGCTAIEETFLDRMGVSWTDAVALMGAHTLGSGHEEFSGHEGTWVDSVRESLVFDKRFYEEVVRRNWVPRQTDSAGVNWTWGGNGRNVMMLNTDICLRFDIPDGNEQSCCTDDANRNGCPREINDVCTSSENARPEAFEAFESFLANNNNNDPFYEAYSVAWQKATENGYDSLRELQDTCGPPGPTPSPVVRPPVQAPSPVVRPPTSDDDNNSCVTSTMYEDINRNIESMANAIRNNDDRSHFLGGVVRLAAVSYIFILSFFYHSTLILYLTVHLSTSSFHH